MNMLCTVHGCCTLYIWYYPLLNTASKTKWCCFRPNVTANNVIMNRRTTTKKKQSERVHALHHEPHKWDLKCLYSLFKCLYCAHFTRKRKSIGNVGNSDIFSCRTNNYNLFLMMRSWMLFGVQAFNQRSFLQYNSIDSLLISLGQWQLKNHQSNIRLFHTIFLSRWKQKWKS